VTKRPFRSPAISRGYPLDDEEREQVGSVAKTGRWVVRSKRGGWEVRREGAIRSSARADTQREAVDRAREIALRAGGGDIVVHSRDGKLRDSNTVHVDARDPHPPKG
jgi:hypothetical protein